MPFSSHNLWIERWLLPYGQRSDAMCSCLQCHVGIIIAVIQHFDQSNLGRKGFIWLVVPHLSQSLKEVRAGTQTGQESGGKSWCRGQRSVLLVAPLCLAQQAFLYKPGTPPRGGLLTVVCAPLHQSLIKKCPTGAYNLILCHFHLWGTLHPKTLACFKLHKNIQYKWSE